MRKIQLSLILVFFFSMLFANQVDLHRAEKVAKNIYFERVNVNNNIDINKINLTHAYTETKDGLNLYYVFNVNNNDGFVIVSADDVVKPIIAFSFEKNYKLESVSPEQAFYMENNFTKPILDAIKNNVRPSDEITSEWQKYEFGTKSVNEIQAVEPLIITTWGQGSPYNNMCPVENGEHCVVGCVAISFSQLLKYWNYPAQGVGNHSYYDYGSGTQSADYGNTEYHFENIPLDANGPNDYLARLLYHCGVAVNMDYNVDGSGSQTTRIATGLKTYFKYNSDAEYVNMNDYSPSAWLTLLKGQIDNGWPMSYDGFSSEGGHAWNCDGYNGNQMHMNWGWDGYQNGFYSVSNPNGYSTEGAVINVYPETLPTGCNSITATGINGAFEDGSVNNDYNNNLDCTYHIVPECGSYATVSFETFDIGEGDHVYIYDGSTTSAPLLADYDNSSNNPSNVSSTTTDGLLVNFVTDGSGTAKGWDITYTTSQCKSSTVLTAPSGYVEDGSKDCDYNHNSVCRWYIEPSGATSVMLDFSEFELGNTYDYLEIFKGHSTSSSKLVAQYHMGDNPDLLNVIDEKATVRFVTSLGDDGAGWKFHYDISTTSLDENFDDFVNSVKVYPNPFSSDANIEFNTNTSSNVNISIVNVLGKKIGEINREYSNGTQSVKISEIVSSIENGIYFVKFNSDDLEKTIKIVVSK